MKRIVLACAAGMSTSMVVTRMEKEAAARGMAFQIYAIPEQNLREELQNYGHDVVAVLLDRRCASGLRRIKNSPTATSCRLR